MQGGKKRVQRFALDDKHILNLKCIITIANI